MLLFCAKTVMIGSHSILKLPGTFTIRYPTTESAVGHETIEEEW